MSYVILSHLEMDGKLSSHPRCHKCGETSHSQVGHYQEFAALEFHCFHAVMAYEHTGKKLDHCPICAGSDFIMQSGGEILCPLCHGKFQS